MQIPEWRNGEAEADEEEVTRPGGPQEGGNGIRTGISSFLFSYQQGLQNLRRQVGLGSSSVYRL